MVITMVKNEAVLVTKNSVFAKVDVSNKMIKPVKYEHIEIF